MEERQKEGKKHASLGSCHTHTNRCQSPHAKFWKERKFYIFFTRRQMRGARAEENNRNRVFVCRRRLFITNIDSTTNIHQVVHLKGPQQPGALLRQPLTMGQKVAIVRVVPSFGCSFVPSPHFVEKWRHCPYKCEEIGEMLVQFTSSGAVTIIGTSKRQVLPVDGPMVED